MRFQEFPDYALVLQHIERAGGIGESPAGLHHDRGGFQDFPLPRGAPCRAARRPGVPRFGFPPEHALAGAGRVREHRVEGVRPNLRQFVRRFTDHRRVPYAHALEVPGQNLRAARGDLVGHQRALSAHPRRHLRRLSARSGAQVQDHLARLRREHLRGRLGAGLLHVVDARRVGDVLARPDGIAGLQVASEGRPGHALPRPNRPRALPERVQPERQRRFPVHRSEERFVFVFQKAAHPGKPLRLKIHASAPFPASNLWQGSHRSRRLVRRERSFHNQCVDWWRKHFL